MANRFGLNSGVASWGSSFDRTWRRPRRRWQSQLVTTTPGRGAALLPDLGASVEMISQTYGHLVPDLEDYLLRLLDDYNARQVSNG